MKKIFHFLFSNLNFKIIAIMLALVIWFLAGLFRTNKVNITIPIEFYKLPVELVITEINTENIKLGLEGKGSDFMRIYLTPPKYRLNLTEAKYGTNRFRIDENDITRLSPIAVKSISPDFLEIKTDYLDSTKIAVVVPYRLEQQKGIYITSITVLDSPVLYGPEAQLPFIRELVCESLFISSYSSNPIERKLKILLPDKKIYWTRSDSVAIRANVEKEETRIFENVPLKIVAPVKKKISVIPDSAQITLRGPAGIIQNLNQTDIKVNLNLSKLEPGQYKLPVEILLPRSVFLVKCEPALFEITIP